MEYEVTVIREEINVLPNLFDRNKMKENLLTYLNAIKRHKYDKVCDKLIRGVKRVVDVRDSRISMADSTIWLDVEYEVEYIASDIGSVIDGTAIAILDEGIFVSNVDSFKILCVGGKKTESGAYKFDVCGCEYALGDKLSTIITAKDSKDQVLYCVGKHRHLDIFSKFLLNDSAILNTY